MRPTIVAVVEGPGDQEAISVILRRWFHTNQVFAFEIRVLTAKGVGNILVPANDQAQRGMEYWIRKALNFQPCAIMVVLDADDECETPRHRPPEVKLGPWLLSRAKAIAAHVPISVVVADRRFESWFLCKPCQEALCDQGLFQRTDLDAADRAKGRSDTRLRLLMGRAYSKTMDQVRLAHHMPLSPEMASASRSFQKLRQELEKLCREVARATGADSGGPHAP